MCGREDQQGIMASVMNEVKTLTFVKFICLSNENDEKLNSYELMSTYPHQKKCAVCINAHVIIYCLFIRSEVIRIFKIREPAFLTVFHVEINQQFSIEKKNQKQNKGNKEYVVFFCS